MAYFFVKSRLSGHVMDVEGGDRSPGTHIILWEKKDHDMSNSNQLFYEDTNTNCIKSALNDLCLSMNQDNELVLHHPNNSSMQRWQKDGDKVRNCDDNQVLDVVGESTDMGAKVCKWDDHGGVNQQWDFEYVEPKYFYIRSRMHGKVLDVSGENRSEGAEVIVWPQNDDQVDNQLWFEGTDGIIRSKLNSFTLDARDGELKLYQAHEGEQNQGFRINGDQITNKHDHRCMDIAGENEDDGAKVCAWESHDGVNQKWEIAYI